MEHSHDIVQLPPNLYEGSFAHSREALTLARELAALERPISLYYPGSSSDGSFTRLPDVHAIHVDSALDDTAIRDFEVLGAEAYRADAYTWSPAEPIDVVTLINPSGIDEDRVLGMSQLRDDGIVLWASWSGVPSRLVERKDMRLIGVISDPGEGDLTVDTEKLGDYFTRKAFTALDDSEQAFFMRRLQQYLDQYGLDLTVPAESLYEHLRAPDGRELARDMDYQPPYTKAGTFFIFRKVAPETS